MTTITIRHLPDLPRVAMQVLGFMPTDALTMIGVGSPNGSSAARLDLDRSSSVTGAADALAPWVSGAGFTAMIALVWTDDAIARERGVEAASMFAGLVSSLYIACTDGRRIWWANKPDTAIDLDLGEVPPSRAQIEAAYARDPNLAEAVELASSRSWPAQEIPEHIDTLLRALATRDLYPHELAELIANTRDMARRDVAWVLITRENARAMSRLWQVALTAAGDDDVPHTAALAGFAAWLHGDGARAWMAIDRAGKTDYTMIGLVREALTMGMAPTHWTPPLTVAEAVAQAEAA